jgi:hypothetical protein
MEEKIMDGKNEEVKKEELKEEIKIKTEEKSVN